MARLTLEQAATIVDVSLAKGREMGLNPLTVSVVDDGGHLKAFKREDGPGAGLRPQIATGKAAGAVGMGRSSRRLGEMAAERPHFVNALVGASQGRLVPVPGGVLIQDGDEIVGAVGVSGDTSDNDETVAVAGIEAAGLSAGI
ncbi:MAG: heme-binding protein [Defluviicoccus sp.]|nr:heme-binding protein [Defluviicoccus sp.]MDE0382964.1 heme-binding protein [Defluviicoccus sp.]